MTDKRKPQLEPTVNTTGVEQGFDRIKQKGQELGASLQQSGQQGAKGVGAIGDTAEQSAKKIDRETKNIIGSIERATAAAKAGERGTAAYFEAIGQQRGVSGEALKPYLEQLRQAEAAQKLATGGLNNMAMSAKATTAALRQVPAQLTDIVVSLQGGQAPLTVLLQQGGQLKDVFGGIGPAAKALGGYVAGLVNPFTLAAAGAAALAYAYNQGANEAQAFRQTVILTGGAAGVTAGQLSDMAASIAKLGGGTQGRAAEVLNAMAQSSAIGAANLERFTAAAVKLEKVGGPAAEETAKTFAELAKSPLAATLKLNEGTNFLTRSILTQIKALEDQGRTLEAGKVAQEAYFSAVNERTPALLQNLGLAERAWLGIKDAIKGAADATLSVGRADTLSESIARMEQEAKRLRGAANNNGVAKPGELFSALTGGPSLAQQATAAEQLVQQLKEGARVQAQLAAAGAEHTKQVKAAAEWDKESDKYLTRREQMERAITKARNEGTAAGAEQVEIEKRIAVIRQQYDPGTNIEAIKQAEAQRLEVLKRSQLGVDALRAQGALNEYELIERTTKLELEAISVRRAAAVGELAIVSKRQNAEKETAALSGQIALLDEQAKTRKVQGEYQIAEALNKRRVAGEAANEAERREFDAEASARLRAQLDVRQQIEETLRSQVLGLRDETAVLNLEASLVGQTNLVRNTALAQLRIELDLRRQLEALGSADVPGGEDERRRLRAQAQANAEAAKANAARKVEFDEWQKVNDQISQSLTDALMNGGKSGFDYLKSYARTLVFRPVLEFVTRPIAGLIQSALGGVTNSIGNALGLGGNALGAGLQGYQLYNLSAGAGLFGSAAAYGAALGTTTIGAGSQAAMLAAQTGAFGAEGAALTAAAAGNAGASALLAAAPWLAGLAGLAAIVSSLDHSGTPHTGASSAFSTGTGLTVGQGLNGVGSKAGDYSTQTEALTSGLVKGIVGILDSTASTFGKQAGYSAAAAFADDSSKDGAWGALAIKLGDQLVGGFGAEGNGRWPGRGFADGEAGSKEYLAAVSADVRRALEDIGLPSWAKGMLDSLGTAPSIEQLGETVARINATQSALVNLGSALPQLAGLAGEAVTGLLTAFGGVENLTNAAGSYYQNFYTEAERAAASTRQITKALGDLGYGLPTSREGFRSLVEAQDLATESGRNTYAALLKLSPAFAEITAATTTLADTAAEAAAKMAEAGRKALADLAGERGGLNVDLLRAQGNTAEADALARQQALAKITAGLSATDAAAATAAYDFNEALRQQIAALGLAKTAAEQLATQQAQQAAQALAQQQAVASQRYGLEGQLLQLQGDTAALRERELAALDASNRALQKQIYALTDQQAAATAAAAAAATAAQAVLAFQSTLDGLSSTRFDLQNQLLSLQGNTEEVARRTRERDLAQLTAGLSATDAAKVAAAYDLNTALQKQVADTQAAQRAAEELAATQARAAEEAARAAEQFKNAWQSVTDSIFSEVARIRGLLGGQSPLSFANAQSQFAIATGQARAGDQEAAKLLPGLSQTLLQLAEAQATSLVELQLIRARTAASLAGTGSGLAGMYGLTIPRLATGTNFVPRDMLAMLHAGEEVTPRAWNPAAGGAGREERLMAVIEGLRADIRTGDTRIVELQLQLNKLLKKWDLDGLPTERVTTA